MSGGHFDYNQSRIGMIADELEQLIIDNGREKTKDELKETWREPEWYIKYPEDKYHTNYPDEVIEKFKAGLIILRQAYVYTQRIDWLLSGDDGSETFLNRLTEDLEKLTK